MNQPRINDMPGNVIRLPARPDDCIRFAPGTDLRDVPGAHNSRSVTTLLRGEPDSDPATYRPMVITMLAILLAGLLVLGWMGGP